MNMIESFRIRPRRGPFPDDLALKVLVPEHLVHQHLDVVDGVPVEVNVDGARRREQVLEQLQAAAEHDEEAVEAVPPGVSVGEGLDEGGLLLGLDVGVFVEWDGDGVVGAEVAVHHEGRIDVDEVDLAPVAVVPGLGSRSFRRVCSATRLSLVQMSDWGDLASPRRAPTSRTFTSRQRAGPAFVGLQGSGAAGAHDLHHLRGHRGDGLALVHPEPREPGLAGVHLQGHGPRPHLVDHPESAPRGRSRRAPCPYPSRPPRAPCRGTSGRRGRARRAPPRGSPRRCRRACARSPPSGRRRAARGPARRSVRAGCRCRGVRAGQRWTSQGLSQGKDRQAHRRRRPGGRVAEDSPGS
jgi:hypothetical protein